MTNTSARHRRARRSAAAVAVVAALALAACGDDTTDPTTEPTMPDTTGQTGQTDQTGQTGQTLDGRTFLSTATTDFDLVTGSVVRLTFSDGVIGIQAGCNSMGGDYSLDDSTLVLGTLSSTEMACDQQLMDQDTRMAELLSSGPTIALDGDTLTITSSSASSASSVSSASITFVDREVADPDRPLEGTTWTLDSLVTGDAVSSVPAGVIATLTIIDGRARVAAGCNTGGASVTVGDGTIEFGPMALTKMACASEAMDVETAVTSVLSGTTTFTIDAGRLTVTAGTPTTATTALSFTAES